MILGYSLEIKIYQFRWVVVAEEIRGFLEGQVVRIVVVRFVVARFVVVRIVVVRIVVVGSQLAVHADYLD